jgi:hypothetical protein
MSYNSGGGGASLASQIQKVIDQIMNDQLNEAKFSAMLNTAGQEGVRVAKSQTPVRTGNLQRGNQAEVSGLTLHFHNDVDYAGIVNYGTSTRPPRLFFDAGVEAIQQNIDQSLSQK